MVTDYDVVIIGGGPAGMAAAVGAKENGVGRVLIIDRESRLGGILPQCIHPGFGLVMFDRQLTGPEYAEEYISRLKELAIDCRLDTSVLSLSREKRITVSGTLSGIGTISAGAVVLAMGCRERTRGNLGYPASAPPASSPQAPHRGS